ncbi:Zn-dependent M28 family amino/carboxypeptidase [Actinokineospora baliensis]|uniref:M28 family metallopeptidase n=1 Tax=Actinokineospora baliensis TaxID=547056 RepID=UPI00195DD7D2|nr:M28 family metallopeptidase [Actinokineospora baliensis]MBM7771264.1 Zn-dependent M28 family amino/carboxypeptidase [Actinokineospora baliensis]
MPKSQTLRVGAAILAATGALAFTTIPSSAAPVAAAEIPDGPALAKNLVKKVTGAGVNRHLIALQRIADKNGGTRAAGTPGHAQSAEYVESQLLAAGFDVSRHSFPFTFVQTLAEKLSVAGRSVPISIMTYSLSTPVGGITAPLAVVPVDATPGCEAADYATLNVTGKIALVQRGACSFADKQRLAAEAGAVAAIVYNNVDGALAGTLSDPANAKIPTGGLSKADGEALAAASNGAATTVELRALREERTSYNVIAQTKTGRKNNVVMAGSHLDSVVAGPGINDNGSGSAALLETALQLGGSPKVNNAVRFAWWSAEELGLVGSKKYVQSLTFEQQLDIALYLNFDMIASPNTGYFVYDGDNSDNVGAGEGPYGSAQIEAAFHSFLNTTGTPTEGTDFTGRSDYGEFILNGIPAGGLFTGAEQLKTQAQADKWGGLAGVAYDKNYHGKGDNLGNIDRVALDRNSDAIAWVTASYAISTEDINGVPPRAARADARVAAKSRMRAQLVHEDETAAAHGAGCIHVNELAI